VCTLPHLPPAEVAEPVMPEPRGTRSTLAMYVLASC